MSASLSASLRADYGGALNRCVAIIGRTSCPRKGYGYGKAPTRYPTSSIMMMWFLSPRPCAFLALLPFVLVKCARFRDGELNPTSIKEVGLSCGG
eukprot:scaffold8631_cov108-Isochrysis_galbana.AAC.3